MSKNTIFSGQYYFKFDNIANKSVGILVNSCGETLIKKHFQTKMDFGRLDYYLMYIISGRMEAVIDGKSGILERGTAVCITPNTPYFYTPAPDSSDYVSYRFIHFTGSNVDTVLRASSFPTNEIMKIEFSEKVCSLWDDLFYEFRNNTDNADSLGALILPYILMKVGKSRQDSDDGGRKLDFSISYIHANLSSPLSVEELAAMEFLSVSRYREVFRNVTGHSPMEYIIMLRIRQAVELLSEGNFSIEEAARAVGYTDRLYFQRVFKKYMGVTPGNYLRKVKH